MKIKTLAIYAIPVLLSILAGCILEEKEARRGSVIENEVYGTLLTKNGDPAVGAKVQVFPVDYVPNKALFKVSRDSGIVELTTDSRGRYYLDSLVAGQYNILGEQAGLLSYQDSIVLSTRTDSIPADTLSTAGSITARVKLEPNHDPRTVFVQVLGTNRFVNTDSLGRFTLFNLAEGEYSIRVLTTLDEYTPRFSSLRVRSGKADTLQEPILIAYSGIPVAPNLTASYDTVNESTRLQWGSVRYAFLKEYLVYRSVSGSLSNSATLIARIKDTSFVDDLSAFAEDLNNLATPKFEYQLKVRNLSNQDGFFFGSVEVEAISKRVVTTSFSFTSNGKEEIRGSVGDTLPLVMSWNNMARNLDSLSWLSTSSESPLKKVRVVGKTGSDTLKLILGREAGNIEITARMVDESKVVWIGSVTVTIVQDIPTANAGVDTLVSIGDKVNLKGTAEQNFGSIVKWEWDIGNKGNFIATHSGDTAIQVGKFEEILSNILRVTDDDGNVALDTMEISIVKDIPKVNAGKDTTVSIGDKVNIKGTAEQNFGTIVKWEWDIGNKGNFSVTTTGDTSIQVGNVIGRQINVLRVTDDDGNVALDTMRVIIQNDFPAIILTWESRLFSLGSGYTFNARFKDLGTIVKWEWEIDHSGIWITTNKPDTAFSPNKPAGTFLTVKVRGTDEDGNSSVDSASIKVSKWAKFASIEDLGRCGDKFNTAQVNGLIYLDCGLIQYFNPAKGTADKLTDPPTNLYRSAMVALNDNLYLMGGGSNLKEMWRYNPGLDLWSPLAEMPYLGVSGNAAVMDNEIFMLGGWGNNDQMVYQYTPALDYWRKRPAKRGFIGATAFSLQGKIYAFGVIDGHSTIDGSFKPFFFSFDPITDEWKTLSIPPSSLISTWNSQNVSVIGVGTKAYILCNGNRTLIYSPESDSWQEKSNALFPFGDKGVEVIDGRFYAFSMGLDAQGQPTGKIEVQTYLPSDDQ